VCVQEEGGWNKGRLRGGAAPLDRQGPSIG
jgi:hypothetical protein